jgi:hypothetical protein
MPGASGERSITRDAEFMMTIHDLLKFWITDKPQPMMKEDWLE